MNTTDAFPEHSTTNDQGSSGSTAGPSGTPDTGTPWPSGAKALVAVLAVALVAALVAAIAFAARSDDSEAERLRDELASVVRERDGAIAAGEELDAELADVRAANDELTGAAEELTETVSRLEEQIAALEAEAATAETDLATVTAERDALAELFPIEFVSSLAELDLVGDHEIELTELDCSGLATCGTLPAIDEITIGRTAQGWLQLTIPDLAEGALIRADGALHMVVASPEAVPQCDGADRRARVTMTLVPGSHTVADDGESTVATVAGVLTVVAPETGPCEAATAFYSVELTPAA